MKEGIGLHMLLHGSAEGLQLCPRKQVLDLFSFKNGLIAVHTL